MIGHYYVEEKVLPNCVEQGYTLHTCKNCGNSYKDDFIEPKQHQYGEWHNRETVSCNQSGINYRECKVCGYEDTKVLAALGHTPGKETIEYDATCEEDGLKVTRCTECNAIIDSEKIPAIEHIYTKKVVAADCTHEGYTLYTCSKCQFSYQADIVDKINHRYDEWKEEKQLQCGKQEKHTVFAKSVLKESCSC